MGICRIVLTIIAILICRRVTALAQGRPEPEIGVLLPGDGFDAPSGSRASSICVSGSDRFVPIQVREFDLKRVTSAKMMMHELQISAAAKFKLGIWGNASAAADYLRTSAYEESTTIFVAKAKVYTEDQQLVDIDLKKKHLGKNFKRFNCGTHYVASVAWGGWVSVVLEDHFESKTEADRFASVVSASMNGISVNQSSRLTNALKQFSSSTRLSYLIRSTKDAPEDLSLAGLQTYVAALPNKIKTKTDSVPVAFALKEYPDHTVNQFDEDALFDVGAAIDLATTRMANATGVLSNHDLYAFPIPNAMNKAESMAIIERNRTALERYVTDETRRAKACIESEATCAAAVVPLAPLPRKLDRPFEVPQPGGRPSMARGGCILWSVDGRVCKECTFDAIEPFLVGSQTDGFFQTCPALPNGDATVEYWFPLVECNDPGNGSSSLTGYVHTTPKVSSEKQLFAKSGSNNYVVQGQIEVPISGNRSLTVSVYNQTCSRTRGANEMYFAARAYVHIAGAGNQHLFLSK